MGIAGIPSVSVFNEARATPITLLSTGRAALTEAMKVMLSIAQPSISNICRF